MAEPSSEKGYDRLAPWYKTLEHLAFGSLLMESRIALLEHLPQVQTALVLGEGDGRFLEAFLTCQPHCQVTCLEQSSQMITKAVSRLKRTGLDAQVQFFQGDFTSFQLQPHAFDVIITTFVLDLFEDNTLRHLIPKLARSLEPEGFWYYADFHVPETGYATYRARLWLTLLYAFFRWQTNLQTCKLLDPEPFLEANGFTLLAEVYLSRDLLVTRLYRQNVF